MTDLPFGDWRGRLDQLEVLVRQCLARRVALTPSDRVALEQLADQAVPFGLFQAADDLLAGLALTARPRALVGELADSLPPAERAVYLLNKWTVEEKALAAEIDRLVRLKKETEAAPGYARPWKRWRLWQRFHAFLRHLDADRRQLARRHSSGAGPASVSPPGALGRWLWRQPRDTATLSFLVLPDRVLVACSGWMSLDFAVRPVTRLWLREQVKAWHKLARDWDDGWDVPPEKLGVLADELARALDLPRLLETLPRRVRRLRIVADDSLHGFPFAALRFRGRYLIEQYALTRATTARRCRRLQAPGPARRWPSPSRAGRARSLPWERPGRRWRKSGTAWPHGESPCAPSSTRTGPTGRRCCAPGRRPGWFIWRVTGSSSRTSRTPRGWC